MRGLRSNAYCTVAIALAPASKRRSVNSTRPSRRKQVIAGLVTLVVLVIVFFGIFPKFANYSEAWESIQEMSASSLALFALATVANILIYVFPYQAALPGLAYGRAFIVRQTSFMISNAVPAGGAFGLGVQYAMLNGYGIDPAVSTSAIGVTSVWNLMVTLALPALGLLALVFSDEAAARAALADRFPVLVQMEKYGDGKPYQYQYDGAPTCNDQLLIARRLVEAGVRCVTLSYGRWDSHGENFKLVRDHGSKLDQCLSALIEDLDARGRLDDTLIAVWCEFGRTP